MDAIIDTNVPLVANGAADHVSPECRKAVIEFLVAFTADGVIVIDTNWHILREYLNKLNSSGQPGIGDGFLKWVLTNQHNPQRCRQIPITKQDQSFLEFPDDPALARFDLADRKFVAVAIADPLHPPIYNATDSDWDEYEHSTTLANYGIIIKQLCP